MILFRCTCGAAHQVDSKFAGGEAQCDKCGSHVSVPAASDPDVRLVYHAGGDPQGQPMAFDEIRSMRAAEALRPLDLAWEDGNWLPLAQVLGESMELSSGPPDEECEGGPLERTIGELEPIYLDDDVDPEPFLSTGPQGPPVPAAAAPTRPKTSPAKLVGVLVLLAVAALACYWSFFLRTRDRKPGPPSRGQQARQGQQGGKPANSGGNTGNQGGGQQKPKPRGGGDRPNQGGGSKQPTEFGGGGGLSSAKIGKLEVPSGHTAVGNIIQLTGGGADIWSTADGCYFACRRVRTDVVAMRVHLRALDEVHERSKAGLMIRESPKPGARMVVIVATPRNGVNVQVRKEPGAEAEDAGRHTDRKIPQWLELSKRGRYILARMSADGREWAEAGKLEVAIGADMLIGLTVTSHTPGKAATATFENLQVQIK